MEPLGWTFYWERRFAGYCAERVVRAEHVEAAHGAPRASQASQALHAALAAHEARAARAAWSEEQERWYEEGARKVKRETARALALFFRAAFLRGGGGPNALLRVL